MNLINYFEMPINFILLKKPSLEDKTLKNPFKVSAQFSSMLYGFENYSLDVPPKMLPRRSQRRLSY